MRVCLIGKIGSVTHWLEDCAACLAQAGHEVLVCPTRNPRLSPAVEALLFSERIGAPRAALIVRTVRRFRPDLVLAVRGFEMPHAVLDRLRAWPDRPPLAAWVGDAFTAADHATAGRYDLVAYTDSFFTGQHETLGFASRCLYLPHAANTRLSEPDRTERLPRLVCVANPTPNRIALLRQLRSAVELYGPGWQAFADAPHAIHARRLDVAALAAAYRGHIGVLNIRHETNVVHGLNQRSFDPYVLGAPVVSDDQPDLRACFDEGREILIYRDAAELEEIYARLRREPQCAQEIGQAGRRRMLAEHGYTHRLDRIAAALR